MSQLKKLEVFVHAIIRPRLGSSSWAYVIYQDNEFVAECWSGTRTNRHTRAQLKAISAGIEDAIKNLEANIIKIHGANAFIVKAFRKWAVAWEIRGWKNKEGGLCADPEEWALILEHRDRLSVSNATFRHNGFGRAKACAESAIIAQMMTGKLERRTRRVRHLSPAQCITS